jgi:hypothetical protein
MALQVEITVRGRLGASLLAAVPELHARLVPRHDALVIDQGGTGELLDLLRSLETARLDVDRIDRIDRIDRAVAE